jgi:hypothetical protein
MRIEKDTHAFERAQPTLTHINSTLAYKLSNEAVRLSRSRDKEDWLEARQKALSALEYEPGDEKTEELVAEIEKKLKDKKVKF